jgi:hypothetical protein
MKTHGVQPERPFRDDHLLRANELLHAFLTLEIMYYCESDAPAPSDRYPLASLVARKG